MSKMTVMHNKKKSRVMRQYSNKYYVLRITYYPSSIVRGRGGGANDQRGEE